MEFFLENWLLVNGLEFGLEVVECLSATVGSTACVGKVEARVFGLVYKRAPVRSEVSRCRAFGEQFGVS